MQNDGVLSFLLHVSFVLDDGLSPIVLQLLQCALCPSAPPPQPPPPSTAPQPASSSSPAMASRPFKFMIKEGDQVTVNDHVVLTLHTAYDTKLSLTAPSKIRTTPIVCIDMLKEWGATCQRGAGQTLDMKSNLCPSSVQCLSKLCPTSVQVQGLSSCCPGQVHSLSKLCLRSVHLQTPWTGIGHTGPVFVQFLSSRGSKMLYFTVWTNIV